MYVYLFVVVYLTLTDPLRIQPWSQDRRNQTKSNRKSEISRESRHKSMYGQCDPPPEYMLWPTYIHTYIILRIKICLRRKWTTSDGVTVCVRVLCIFIPFILNVRLVDVPAGVAQYFSTFPSALVALIFIARRIQPSPSLVDREVEFCIPTNQSFYTTSCWV